MNNFKDMNEYAAEHQVPILQEEGMELLIKKIQEYDCHSFLEIGTAIGKTSLIVAGLKPDMKVVTIERNPEMIEQAKENFFDSPFRDKIHLIEGDALDVQLRESFDCIFIDAAKSQYIRFFEKFCPLLTQDGIIITDNMNFHGLVAHPERTHNRSTKQLVRKIKAYEEYLKSLREFETTFYPDGDGIALTKRRK